MNLTDYDGHRYRRRAPTWSPRSIWFRRRAFAYDDPTLTSDLNDLTARARANADGPTTAHFLISLTHLLHAEFPYSPGVTGVDASLAQILLASERACVRTSRTFFSRSAVSRESRLATSAATSTPGGGLQSGDVMHAWVECLLPDAYAWVGGSPWIWRGFDPTNDLVAGKSFIKTHVGLDYDGCLPDSRQLRWRALRAPGRLGPRHAERRTRPWLNEAA